MVSDIPSVSIVMPLFNKEAEVSRAIRSVLYQTFTDFELVVINDGSTDKGPEVVRGINDPRIRIIDQENGGVSVARNRGIEEAKSGLITFLDADDEWLPEFLGTIDRLRTTYSYCSGFATNYWYRSVDGSLIATILRGLPKPPWEGLIKDYFKVASQSDPPIWSSAIAVRKAALTSIGGFPIGVKAGEDLITWAKLALKYKIAYSTYPSAIFYLRESLWGRPTRIPDSVDRVGKELERMLDTEENKKIEGLKEYIAHWHQMRASMFLRLGKHKETIYEVKKIAEYSKKNMRLYIFFLMALMPRRMCNCVCRATNDLRYLCRKITIPTSNISK